MEIHKSIPPIREYAPGVTDPAEFARIIKQNPFYVTGDYRTRDGRKEIVRRIYKIDTEDLLNLPSGMGELGGGTSSERNKLITEKRVLEDLLFHKFI